jgi:ornithine cyclodeaminase/alanine dehydrogenase-like protein (mu-crystallin family)
MKQADNGIQFQYFSQEDLREAGLTMKMALQAVEEAYTLYGQGKVDLPDKVVLDLGEKERGRINALCAYVGGDIDLCGIKWIASFPLNPLKNKMPRATALLILNDSYTGVPLAVMDGTIISSLRTGAVAGVTSKYLANKNSTTAAIIGTSVIARASACAITEAMGDMREIRAYSIDSLAKRHEFAKQISDETDVKVTVVDSAEGAVKNADIIVTATTADTPIVMSRWIKKGSLFVHLGSYQEEDYETILDSDKIVVDSWQAVKHRRTPTLARMYDAGLIGDQNIYGEIGEITSGKKPGRVLSEERIYCLPIGLGILDIALAGRVYKNAIRNGIGLKLNLWENPDRYAV